MVFEPKNRLDGRIVAVQENRFRLAADTGRGYVFTLHHSCGTSIEDLQRWHDADARLTVAYTGEPNIATGVAHSVRPSGGRP
jgi:hypothetical protein